MSFSENLQSLRKASGISQEQLAERLDVSRQAVSKWETDGGYPEMEKISMLCEIFGVTMDELIRGQVEIDRADIRKKYDKNKKQLAVGIALGASLILFGVAISSFVIDLNVRRWDTLGTAVMFVFIAVAVALFVICGSKNSAFGRANPIIPEIYTQEERERYESKIFPLYIASGIALVFLGVGISTVGGEFPGTVFGKIANTLCLVCIAPAVGMFVYASIMRGKYNIKGYNRKRDFEQGIKETDSPETVQWKKKRMLLARLCGVIMLTATAVFLGVGLIANVWYPTSVIFPISGILCGILAIVMGGRRKGE